RDDREIFGRVLQLHRVTFFAGEIDQDLVEKNIPLRHASESPALVQAKRARLERVQFLGRFGSEFAGFNKFFELSVHQSRTNYDEGPRWQASGPNVFRLPSRAWHETLR